MHAAVAGRGDDDAVARRRRAARRPAAPRPGAARDDLDPRPARCSIAAATRHRARVASPASRAAAQPPFLDSSDRPGIARAERIDAVGVHLAHVGAPMHARRRARRRTPRAPALARDRDRIEQVLRAVGLQRVAGRIAAVSTTGLAGASTRCRNHAVSSSVSVPCVTTMPATSARARWLRDAQRQLAPDREVHVLAVELRDLLAFERDAARAPAPPRRAAPHRAARRCSRRCRPASAAVPAIVPPVPSTTTRRCRCFAFLSKLDENTATG